jgi:DNA-directed RNA polymerase specialized sigma24 family protein
MPSQDQDQGSVTRWLGDLKEGDPRAAQRLWQRYFERLARLARRKLHQAHRPPAVADEEDAALSAFDSFCRGLAAGRFPRLDDRDDLWRLLVALTERKATDQLRHAGRRKRGSGRVHREADLIANGSAAGSGSLDRLVGPEPSPEFAALVAEQYRLLFNVLGDDELCQIAAWKLEGYTTEEIAAKLGCACRTVARRLGLIRTLWRAEAEVS